MFSDISQDSIEGAQFDWGMVGYCKVMFGRVVRGESDMTPFLPDNIIAELFQPL